MATGQTVPDTVIRFGAFELDLRADELRRQGVRIRVQEQPLHVLRVLLERPGELVSRDELRTRLWDADTFVDFDNSLNTSVNKLRDALGDSADNPRFIQTIPKRGYRFIAPVAVPERVAVTASIPLTRLSDGRKRRVLLPALGLLIAAGIAVALIWRLQLHRNIGSVKRIVVADFANRTGDAVFDGTLRQGLSVQLEQSPSVTLLPEADIRETLRLMQRRADAPLGPELAAEVCQRAGASCVLTGSIAKVGSTYDLLVRAASCDDGSTLASTEQRATNKDAVLDALTRAAAAIRTTLGESPASLERFATPLMRASTPSIDALRSYSLGYRALVDKGDSAAAMPLLREAIARDPNFAMAYVLLGDASWNVGETAAAADTLRKAYDLRAGLSEVERLRIESEYHSIATGDLEQAKRAFQAWADTFPHDCAPKNRLALVNLVLGQFEQAIPVLEDAMRLCPHSGLIRGNLTYSYLAADRLPEARESARRAAADDPDAPGTEIGLYRLAFLDGNSTEMRRLAASGAGTPGLGDELSWNEAATAAYAGEMSRARGLLAQAVAAAERAGEAETAATYNATFALMLALLGVDDEARALAGGALSGSRGADLVFRCAVALAMTGDDRRARELAGDLATRFPFDTIVQAVYVPTIRAHIALASGDAWSAIHTLDAPLPYERGVAFYPAYVRGLAYLRVSRAPEAAAEFEKIVAARGAVLNHPIGALAHLQRARAYVAAGDRARAREAYNRFLALWNNADARLPLLSAARDERGRLQ